MTHSPAAPEDPILFQFFNEIGIIHQLASTKMERALPSPMTRAQFIMLNHFVRLGGPRSPQALANSFQVTKGAITHTLQRLEARGLISVAPDPSDGRGKLVDITEAGRAAREEAVAALAQAFQDEAQVFAGGSLAEVVEALRRVRRFLDEHR